MNSVRYRAPPSNKARAMALTVSFKKMPLTHHNLLKLRTIAYISIGIICLYATKRFHRRDMAQELEVFRFNQIRIQREIADYRNTSVAYCIHGLQNLLRDYLANIQVLRHQMLESAENYTQSWMSSMMGYHPAVEPYGRMLHHQTEGYLSILHKDFPFVKTLYLERETTKMGVFISDDYYHYGSNDCNALKERSKEAVEYFQDMYNATCSQDFSHTLNPVALSDRMRSLNVGLPSGFLQPEESRKRTWTYIHLIQNAVVSAHGEVSTRNISINPYGCHRIHGYGYHRKSYQEVFTISGAYSKHFYHNTIADLPRLAPYLPFLWQNPQIKIHVGQRTEFHGLLGLSPDRLVTGTVDGRLVYMPAGLPCQKSDILNTQLMSYYLRRNLPNMSRNRNKIILIKKVYNPYRRFRYHAEILEMLQQEAQRRGLTAVEYVDDPIPSLEVTQKMFNTAIMIVGPHGVSLSHMMFCQPGTVVIEGLHQKDQSGTSELCYGSLALALGLRYYGVYLENKSILDYTADDLRTPVQQYLSHLDAIRSGINQAF